jgi:hypothetical protein
MKNLNHLKLNTQNLQFPENEEVLEEDIEYDEYHELIQLYTDHEEGS